MDEIDRKTLAGFRILVAIARADGRLEDAEMSALRDALGAHGALLDRLISEDIDVDVEVAALGDEVTRERVYRAGFALAHADDHMAHDEVGILEKVWPDHEEHSLVEEVFGEVKDTLLPSNIVPIADPAKRQDEIDHDTLKYAVIAAIVGATPVPGFGIIADAAVVGIQVKLVRDIGQYWGHTIDGPAARSLLGTAAGGLGMRIAVNNLARFVPGWGSVFAAGTSFATTWAIGRVANTYFAGDRGLSDDAVRDLFKNARKQGESIYQSEKDRVETARRAHEKRVAELNEKVAAKQMSAEEYEQALVDEVARG